MSGLLPGIRQSFMMDDLKIILKKYKISSTKSRLLILKTFLSSVEPKAHAYFVSTGGLNLDRTTVYRILRLFIKKNIIYRIPTTDGICKYLLQKDNTNSNIKGYASFICSRCKKVIPLKIKTAPKVELPANYEQQNMEIIIN